MGVDHRNASCWIIVALGLVSCGHIDLVGTELPAGPEQSSTTAKEPSGELRELVRSSTQTRDEDVRFGYAPLPNLPLPPHQPWNGEAGGVEVEVDPPQLSSYWNLLWGYLIGSAVGMVVGGLVGRATVPATDPYPEEDWKPGYFIGAFAHGLGESLAAAGHVVGGIAIGGISGGAVGLGVGALFIDRDEVVGVDPTILFPRSDRTVFGQAGTYIAESSPDGPVLLTGSDVLRHQVAEFRAIDPMVGLHLNEIGPGLPRCLESPVGLGVLRGALPLRGGRELGMRGEADLRLAGQAMGEGSPP